MEAAYSWLTLLMTTRSPVTEDCCWFQDCKAATDEGSWLQNIDTDQIIPAEYLTLVPSKVSAR